MGIRKLAHFSIRTTDVERSCAFYERVLGFRRGYRPPFAFPGAWLYMGDDERDFGTVHIIGVDPNDPSGLAADERCSRVAPRGDLFICGAAWIFARSAWAWPLPSCGPRPSPRRG